MKTSQGGSQNTRPIVFVIIATIRVMNIIVTVILDNVQVEVVIVNRLGGVQVDFIMRHISVRRGGRNFIRLLTLLPFRASFAPLGLRKLLYRNWFPAVSTYSIRSVALILAEGIPDLHLTTRTLALDGRVLGSSTMDFADQSDVDRGDTIIVVSLLLGPSLELVLRELGIGLPFTTHGTFKPKIEVNSRNMVRSLKIPTWVARQ